MTSVLILSDPHLSKSQRYGLHPYKLFEGVLQHISKQTKTHFEAIFILGDLSQDGLQEDYQVLITLLDQYFPKKDIFLICGNHDHPDNLRQVLKFSPNIHLSENQTILIEDIHFIFLPTQISNQIDGILNNNSFELINKTVSASKNIVLLLHHHILPIGSSIDAFSLQNSDELLTLVRNNPNCIRLILSGHTHKYSRQNYYGTEIITVPSCFVQYDASEKTTPINEQYYSVLSLQNNMIHYGMFQVNNF